MTASVLDQDRIDAALDQLVDRGVLGPDQARAVHDAIAGEAPPGESRGVGLATVVASYVGIGLIVAAGMTLVAQYWDEMSVLTRSLLFGGLAAVLVVAGVFLAGALDRGRGLAWLVAVGAAGGFGAALVSGGDPPGGRVALAAGLVALTVAVPLVVLRRAVPQAFAVVAALVVTALGAGSRLGFGQRGIGTTLWALGIGLGALAIARVLPAEPFTLGLGGLVALIGALVAFGGAPALGATLGGLLAASGYVLSLRRDAAVALAVATITVAMMAPPVLGEWLESGLGAAGILALSGVVILAAVAVHVRLTRRRARRTG